MCTQSLSSGGRGFHAWHNSAVLTTAPSNHKWKMGGTRNQRGALTELRAWRAMQARAARHGALLWKASPPSAKIRPLFPSRDGKSGQHAPFSHPMPAIPQQEENVPAFTCPELRCPTRRQLKFHPLYPSDPNLPAPSPRTRSSESRAPCLSPALLAQGQTLQGSPPPSGPSHRRGRSRRPAGQFSTCCRAPSPNFHHRRNARERASHGPPAVGPWAGRLPLPTVSLAVKGSSGKSHAARRRGAGEDAREAGRAPPAPEPRRVRDPLPRGRPLGARDPDHSQRPFSEEARWGRPPAQPRKDPSLAPARPAPAQPGAARRPPGHPGRSPHRLSPPGAAAAAAAAAAQISLFYARAHVSRDVRLRSRETWAGPAVSSGSARLQVPGTPRPSPELPTPGRGRKEGTRNQSRPARGTLVVPPPPACRLPLGGCLAPYCVE